MVRKSTQVAVGGVTCALCLLLMFMSGLIPFSTYAIPATAGAMLAAIVVENGSGTALMVYGAVSFLSLFMVSDREAALLFLLFFGHYPILFFRLERIRPRLLKKAAKYAVFNLCVVGGYLAAIWLFGMEYLIEGMGDFGQLSLVILLVMGNLLFAVYDRALRNLILFYIQVFRVRYLNRP